MTDTTGLIAGGADARLDVLLLELVARMLALAETNNHLDGWLTTDDRRRLLPHEPPAQRRDVWLSAVVSLALRYANLSVLVPESPDYPELLLRTSRAPAFLFVRGSLNNGGGESIAIVGSRKACEQATAAAHEIAASLASTGMTIVSGLARGVDTAAHRGALSTDGHTTAVVGTGIDVVFPPENRDLVERIARKGAVVSQFPPGHSPSRTSFPVRNAVIAGLAQASLVVDAEESSGTRIEMDYALRFGRPVLLWAPVVSKRPWARSAASCNDAVHFVSSLSEIHDVIRHG